VFFIAFNKYNKPAKPPPTRALTRFFKILKKRSYLILTPFIPAAKKVKLKATPQPSIYISPPLRLKGLLFTLSLLASA